ncbi:MAG: hypothetical protein JNK05_21820 [Myxococcales bacterium]|nr:hypothetical protein [Myxococcales bacterium]
MINAFARWGSLAAVSLAACAPPGAMADAAPDSTTGRPDSGVDVIVSRPDVSLLDTGLLDAAENDGAMRAMTSRDCVRSSADAWTTTRVEATRPDGRCPDRVRVSATASALRACGTIEPCCDYFADCLFEVELDVEHTAMGRACAQPDRRALLRCRCINNRVECDVERQSCPASLPAGWTCSARPGEAVFGVTRCSDCAGSDAGATDSSDAQPDDARD